MGMGVWTLGWWGSVESLKERSGRGGGWRDVAGASVRVGRGPGEGGGFVGGGGGVVGL
jgi:hypothetical protein